MRIGNDGPSEMNGSRSWGPRSLSCRRLAGCGLLSVALLVLVIYLFLPAGQDEDGRWPSCLGQIKSILVFALLDYTEAHQGKLPSMSQFSSVADRAFRGNAGEVINCVEPAGLTGVRHVMVSRWGGANLDSIPDAASAILIYDAVNDRPAYRRYTHYENRLQQLCDLFRRQGLGIGYADGHCEWRVGLTPEMIAEGRDPFRAGR